MVTLKNCKGGEITYIYIFVFTGHRGSAIGAASVILSDQSLGSPMFAMNPAEMASFFLKHQAQTTQSFVYPFFDESRHIYAVVCSSFTTCISSLKALCIITRLVILHSVRFFFPTNYRCLDFIVHMVGGWIYNDKYKNNNGLNNVKIYPIS